MAEAEELEQAVELVERVVAIDIAKASGMVCVHLPHEDKPGFRTQRVFNTVATSGAILDLADGPWNRNPSVGELPLTTARALLVEKSRPAIFARKGHVKLQPSTIRSASSEPRTVLSGTVRPAVPPGGSYPEVLPRRRVATALTFFVVSSRPPPRFHR